MVDSEFGAAPLGTTDTIKISFAGNGCDAQDEIAMAREFCK